MCRKFKAIQGHSLISETCETYTSYLHLYQPDTQLLFEKTKTEHGYILDSVSKSFVMLGHFKTLEITTKNEITAFCKLQHQTR